MQSNYKKHFQSIERSKEESNQMYDYIQGVVTPKNENPVKFEYEYTRGGSLDVLDRVPLPFMGEYIYWLTKTAALGVGLTIGAGFTALSGFWMSDVGFLTMVETWVTSFVDYGVLSTVAEIIKWLGGFGIAAGATVVGFLVKGLTNFSTDFAIHYDRWYAMMQNAKERVDTEGHWEGPPDNRRWVYDWEGFKASMEFRFKMVSYVLTVREYEYDTKGRYIELYAANPPAYFGSNQDLKWFELTKSPTVELY